MLKNNGNREQLLERCSIRSKVEAADQILNKEEVSWQDVTMVRKVLKENCIMVRHEDVPY